MTARKQLSSRACGCGCGRPVEPRRRRYGARYRLGHRVRDRRKPRERLTCACGCEREIEPGRRPDTKFCRGHYQRPPRARRQPMSGIERVRALQREVAHLSALARAGIERRAREQAEAREKAETRPVVPPVPLAARRSGDPSDFGWWS